MIMNVKFIFANVQSETSSEGVHRHVALFETEGFLRYEPGIDGNERPLDWTGLRRHANDHVVKLRLRGEVIDLVRVVSLRDGSIEEWIP
jgi:hypothetical protein